VGIEHKTRRKIDCVHVVATLGSGERGREPEKGGSEIEKVGCKHTRTPAFVVSPLSLSVVMLVLGQNGSGGKNKDRAWGRLWAAANDF